MSEPAEPAARTSGEGPDARAATRPASAGFASFVVLAVLAVAISAVRLRVSPFYPAGNDVNSDFYVYQAIGNSWRDGSLPYSQVYDAKGPFLYVLFLFFAWLRPWSALPALACLALLTFGSGWIILRMARERSASTGAALVAAVTGLLIIYLSPMNVASSFTPEEVTITGVLLVLWLSMRWMADPTSVRPAWWLVDGLFAAAIFWIKFTVVVPWVGLLVGLLVISRRDRTRLRSIARIVLLHAVALGLVTMGIVLTYATRLPTALDFYFFSKRGDVNMAKELPGEIHFIGQLLVDDTAAVLVLAGTLVILVRDSRKSLASRVILVAYLLTLWASVAFVRHPNNLFIPLAFSSVAVVRLTPRTLTRPRDLVIAGVAALTAIGLCLGPLEFAHREYNLLRQAPQISCYRQPSHTEASFRESISTIFARTAGPNQILSPGSLFSARTAVIGQLPMRLKYQFVDPSWAHHMGADSVQTAYLRERTFAFVWVHIPHLNPRSDIMPQLLTSQGHDPESRALATHYLPVLSCRNEVLFTSH